MTLPVHITDTMDTATFFFVCVCVCVCVCMK